MKIRKVDDKPMVIHTKEKAKIHAHEPKGAKIKGSNIYAPFVRREKFLPDIMIWRRQIISFSVNWIMNRIN